MDLFIFAALLSALCYGISDFAGGQASAHTSIPHVLVMSECIGAITLWLLVWVMGHSTIATWAIGVAAIAGILGAVGVAFLYHGIANGHTPVTVPVSAVMCALVPVCYGMLSDGLPTTRVMMGIGLGIVAIVMTSWSGAIRQHAGLWQGMIAGGMFGLFFVLIKIVGQPDGSLAPLAISRSAALCVTIPWLLLRPAARARPRVTGLALLAGLADVGASWAFMVSAQAGRIDIAAVLASLYPAVTVALAFLINRETITRPQRWGLVTTLIATALIAG